MTDDLNQPSDMATATARALIADALHLLDTMTTFSSQIAAAHLAHAIELIDTADVAPTG